MRTTCKGFHAKGSQQAGCSTQFRAYLRNKKIDKVPLAAFRGNRFNIIFYNAAGTYFLRSHIVTTSHGSLNLLLHSILSDLKVLQYIAGCRALGLVDKLVTGPLWCHLCLSDTSILDMSGVYTKMKERFEKWGEDAQPILDGSDHFLPQHEKDDEVSKSLFISTENDAMVQELLQLIFKSFAATAQRLLMDHLPSGKYNEVTDAVVIEETKSVLTTNVNPERDFAVLDRLLSQKPNATHIALESLLLYSHNQTSDWLQCKSTEEREKLLRAARVLSPRQKSRFLLRREEIKLRRQDAVHKKEEEHARKEARELQLKETLTKKVQAIGLWTSEKDVENGLKKIKSLKMKREALKLQINFRRKVLQQTCADKTVFFFSHNGKQHSCPMLASNLIKLFSRVQQVIPSETFISNPESLVNKRIDHLFETDQGELTWFEGTVLENVQDCKEFRVLYDNEDCEYMYPLLEDLANNEVVVYMHD